MGTVIEDVYQFAIRVALFDVITVQTAQLAHLNPCSAAEWRELIGRRMQVEAMMIRPASAEELSQGACPERAIITAFQRRPATTPAR